MRDLLTSLNPPHMREKQDSETLCIQARSYKCSFLPLLSVAHTDNAKLASCMQPTPGPVLLLGTHEYTPVYPKERLPLGSICFLNYQVILAF